MPRTMQMLQEEHRNISRLLDLLDGQITLIESGRETNLDLILQIIDYLRSFPDLYHHPKEDLIFRKLVQRDAARAALFGDLEAEHETCSDRLDAFARAVVVSLLEAETPRSFAAQARAFVDHERRHMAREEDELLPAAMQCLTDDDWREIDLRTAKLRDPLMADHGADQLRLVREALARGADRTAA